MTEISSTAMIEPLADFNGVAAPVVDPDTGYLTPHGLQMLSQFRDFISGCGRVIACDIEYQDTETLLLTPVSSAPLISQYKSYDIFVGTVPAENTGVRTYVRVAPRVGSLPSKSLYRGNAASMAGPGDVLANLLYFFVYIESLDSGDGGFVFK